MEKTKSYIKETLGAHVQMEPIAKEHLGKLPFYIREAFNLHYGKLYNHELIMAEVKNEKNLTISQVEKQLQSLKHAFNKKAVLVINELSSIERKRLIQKGINFIVPGKQLFLPDLLMDLREYNLGRRNTKKKLLPSAQYILLYKILHRDENMKQYSFKQLAEKFNYTQTAITKVVNNLKIHGLCIVEGSKEKYIHFNKPPKELWQQALPLLVNPVIKSIYVDELPGNLTLYSCNASALPEYSDMAGSHQKYRAIEKTLFYSLQKNNEWINMNDKEGNYCLEIWKYNPDKLATGITEETNVDPLSLYLSLRDIHDARIEMALEKIIDKYIW